MKDQSADLVIPSTLRAPDRLAHHAIDNLSAALLDTQMLLRQLADSDPSTESLRFAVNRLKEVGATLSDTLNRFSS